MKAPRITLRCDCGTEGMAAYGERWSCPSCDRTYDTSQIPASDYEQIRSLDRRFRLAVWAVVGVLAVIVLVVAITGQVLSVFAGSGGGAPGMVPVHQADRASAAPKGSSAT